jgi:hypothetical protein
MIKRACQGSFQVSKDQCILMQEEIAKWFPHTRVSEMISLSHGGWSWNEADGVDLLLAFLA